MILVANEEPIDLRSLISKQGIDCDRAPLTFADACFEGNGPLGQVAIGVERKKIPDLLKCIDDGRFTGHQLVGMKKAYRFVFLIVEGEWKPHDQTGVLMQLYGNGDNVYQWGEMRPRTMYRKLRRFLFSVSLGGVVVLYTRSIAHTAFDITELYHWFQKPWNKHTSLQQLHLGSFWQQDGRTDALMSIPSLTRKPSLTREWAARLPGIGVKKSEDAERLFASPRALANADEEDFMRIPGVGIGTAQKIVKQIGGRR
jgi:ERCC4-type nuclease